MSVENLCHRILLAKNQGCKVVYCEECDVTELEVDSMSLRVESESLVQLFEVLKEAINKLSAYKKFKVGRNDNKLISLRTESTGAEGFNASDYKLRRVGNIH